MLAPASIFPAAYKVGGLLVVQFLAHPQIGHDSNALIEPPQSDLRKKAPVPKNRQHGNVHVFFSFGARVDVR
jgi:hypothetical protein